MFYTAVRLRVSGAVYTPCTVLPTVPDHSPWRSSVLVLSSNLILGTAYHLTIYSLAFYTVAP